MNAVERIQLERKLRGWSIRTAASQGGISNQTWSTYETGGAITDGIRRAVRQAFEWPQDWPDNLPAPPMTLGVEEELREQVRALGVQVAEVIQRVEELGAEVERLKRGDGRARGGSPR